jgi:hypothetical protein
MNTSLLSAFEHPQSFRAPRDETAIMPYLQVGRAKHGKCLAYSFVITGRSEPECATDFTVTHVTEFVVH